MMDVIVKIWGFVSGNITELISFMAVVITGINVNEVKKQRKKMYEPLLILEGGFWKSKDRENDYNNVPFLNLRNVGFGTAIDIQVEWDITNYINNHDIAVNGEVISTKMIMLDDGNEVITTIDRSSDIFENFNHILPISIEKEAYELYIPKSVYFNIVKNIIEQNNNHGEIKLKIKYKDINGKQTKNIYKVQIKFAGMEVMNLGEQIKRNVEIELRISTKE